MEERRKHNRLNLISFAESEVYASLITNNNQEVVKENIIPQSFFMVFDKDTDKVVGHLIDISKGGLLIISQAPFEKDTEYHLKKNIKRISSFKAYMSSC